MFRSSTLPSSSFVTSDNDYQPPPTSTPMMHAPELPPAYRGVQPPPGSLPRRSHRHAWWMYAFVIAGVVFAFMFWREQRYRDASTDASYPTAHPEEDENTDAPNDPLFQPFDD
jgi:TRAP-type C4-dicarboxylate transport system permease small subunit